MYWYHDQEASTAHTLRSHVFRNMIVGLGPQFQALDIPFSPFRHSKDISLSRGGFCQLGRKFERLLFGLEVELLAVRVDPVDTYDEEFDY